MMLRMCSLMLILTLSHHIKSVFSQDIFIQSQSSHSESSPIGKFNTKVYFKAWTNQMFIWIFHFSHYIMLNDIQQTIIKSTRVRDVADFCFLAVQMLWTSADLIVLELHVGNKEITRINIHLMYDHCNQMGIQN